MSAITKAAPGPAPSTAAEQPSIARNRRGKRSKSEKEHDKGEQSTKAEHILYETAKDHKQDSHKQQGEITKMQNTLDLEDQAPSSAHTTRVTKEEKEKALAGRWSRLWDR